MRSTVRLITTTTAYAATVLTNMEFAAQALWPGLDVRFVSVSDQWAQMSIAGPQARAILARIVEDDLSNAAFPPLAARPVTLRDFPPVDFPTIHTTEA